MELLILVCLVLSDSRTCSVRTPEQWGCAVAEDCVLLQL